MANIKNTQFIPGVIANGLTSATKSVATINEIVQLNNENKIIHTLDELIFNSPDEKASVLNITGNGTLGSVASNGLKMIKFPGGSTVSLIKSNDSEIIDLSTLDTKVTNTLQNGRTIATINDNKNINVPYATTDNGGIIKLGYSEDGKKYAVQSSNNKAFVEVPWIEYNSDGVKIIKDNNVFKHSKSSIGSNKTKALYEVAIDEYGHITECSEFNLETYITANAENIYEKLEPYIALNFTPRDTPLEVHHIAWENSSPMNIEWTGSIPSDFGNIVLYYDSEETISKTIPSTSEEVNITNITTLQNFSSSDVGLYGIKATYNDSNNSYDTSEKTLNITKVDTKLAILSQVNSIDYDSTGNIVLESTRKNDNTTVRGTIQITENLGNFTLNSSSSDSTHTVTIRNNKVEGATVSIRSINVLFIPNDSLHFNNSATLSIPTTAITLKPEPVLEPDKYWYVGTTKPTSLSQAQIVTSYPAEQTYTNNSGAKSYIFVLTNSDKNVTFIEPNTGTTLGQQDIDTTTISGYKIFGMYSKTVNGGSVKIKIS